MVLLINIKKLFIKTKKKMLFKKGDYKAAVNKFILAMSNQDFELAKTLNTEIQAISNSAFIVDDMDCVERITFIKTGKLPARV